MPQYPVTLIGNLTKDPEFREVGENAYLCRIRIAASRSIPDEEVVGGWRDLDHLYISVEMWGQMAQNVAQTVKKGMSVMVTGRLITNQWVAENQDGTSEQRSNIVVKADRVGLDLSRYVASSRRTDSAFHQVEGVDAPEVLQPHELQQRSTDGHSFVTSSGHNYEPDGSMQAPSKQAVA